MMKNFVKYQMTESMWFSSATYAAYHLHSVRWKWSLSYWLWSSPLLVPHLKYGLRFTIMLSSGQWCDIQNFICLMAGCYWSYTRELKQFHWWTRLICCGYIMWILIHTLQNIQQMTRISIASLCISVIKLTCELWWTVSQISYCVLYLQ